MQILKAILLATATLLCLSTQAASAPEPGILTIGHPVKIGNVEVQLNKVVPAGKDALGGEGFTEYNLTLSNASTDKEAVLTNVVVSVNGEKRAMLKSPDDIVNQGNTTGKSVATNAGASAMGFLGGMLGPLGALGSQMATHAVANKVYVDDPARWREEIKKNGFKQDAEGISVFPSEAATGSIWVKEASDEVADQITLYLKQGGTSKLVKLTLKSE